MAIVRGSVTRVGRWGLGPKGILTEGRVVGKGGGLSWLWEHC